MNKSDTIRVLHLLVTLDVGGIERGFLNFLQEVDRDSYRMDVCIRCSDRSPRSSLIHALGCKIHHCPLDLAHTAFFSNLKRIIAEGNYDIVHNHLGILSGAAVMAARSARVPIITTFHTTGLVPHTTWLRLPIISSVVSVYTRASVAYAVKNSDLITAVSNDVVSSLIKRAVTNSNGKIRILPFGGVNIPELCSDEEKNLFRRSFGWQDDTPLLIHVGNVTHAKNHHGVLEIFAKINRRLPEAKLLLIGHGVNSDPIKDIIAALGIEASVVLLGFQENVYSYLTKCDVFLFPSLYEGLGLAAIEANAAGLPVVGSDIPGLREAVQNGKTALLHDRSDWDGMANSALKLLKDKHFAQELGQAGHRRAIELFSSKLIGRQWIEIYRECLGK